MRARDNFPVILFLSCRVLIHNIDTKIQNGKDLIKIISFKQTSYIRYRGSMLRLLGVSLFKINNWSGLFFNIACSYKCALVFNVYDICHF